MDPLPPHKPLPAHPPIPKPVGHGRRKVPRSFRDFTPADHFNPRTFSREMVWHALKTPATGSVKIPNFPQLSSDQLALTWIGHASFLVQFEGLNAIIDRKFANWLFLLKRLRRPGLRVKDLPPIDLVLLTHAYFDHFHRPTLRKIPSPKIAVMPWGCAPLAQRLGFGRIVELKWWESFGHDDWKVTLVPAEHWGARTLDTAGARSTSPATRPTSKASARSANPSARAGAAAHRRLPPGVLPQGPHGARPSGAILPRSPVALAGADAPRHLQALVRGPRRARPLDQFCEVTSDCPVAIPILLCNTEE